MLYSGTVAAAIEGAFFGITSVAVSLEWDEHAQFDKAADIALWVIEKILANQGTQPQLYNLNIPTQALDRRIPPESRADGHSAVRRKIRKTDRSPRPQLFLGHRRATGANRTRKPT